mmetsp:Transcript_5721/g.8303  ORF Transcript_5721/g.8303 Transcript_5721/m.8303 type:complete len:378 (-) Transcript_5721:636-1769(-)
MVSFKEILRSIAQVNSQVEGNNSSLRPKWHIHQERASKMLNIAETDDTSGAAVVWEFVNCLKNGGSGSRAAGSFIPNPSPYDTTKINILDSSPNTINFHATKHRGHQHSPCVDGTPSPGVVHQDAVYYCFGEKKTKVNLKRQLELIRYVTGTDGHLQRRYGPLAAERQKLWLLWATDDPAGAVFHNVEHHLPVIAVWFRDLWDINIDEHVDLKDITQTQLSSVKREIIDALIASFVLDPSAVGTCPPTRRSSRIRGDKEIVEVADDVEVSAIPDKQIKRKRHEANQSDPLAEAVSDSDDDGEHDSMFDIDVTMPRLRELPLDRVGVLELAYHCAHSGDDYTTVTRKLLDLHQNPIAEEEYKCITQIPKNKLSWPCTL